MNLSRADIVNEKVYNRQRKIIENKLSKVLRNNKPKSLYEPCNYIITSGGKRLRSFLVQAAAKFAGGKYSDVYNASIAVELFHNFTLVHDDIMDHADKRRGRATLHKKYDVNTAILAGDNLIALAYKYLLKDYRNNGISIVSNFTQGIIEVCEGQSYDTDFELQKDVSIQNYKLMIRKKTAALLEMSCVIGSEIAGGKKELTKALGKYGKNLGMAFQLQDDLLDIIGDEKEFGKAVGGDLMEGKKTYLFLKALEKAKGEDKKDLRKVITNKGISKNEIKKYRDIYLKYNVIKDAEKEINRYTKLALKSIEGFGTINEREMLNWLAHYLIKRKS